MSEADRLWREAMEHVARIFQAIAPEGNTPERALFRMFLTGVAVRIRNLRRPAGWGEGGKDE